MARRAVKVRLSRARGPAAILLVVLLVAAALLTRYSAPAGLPTQGVVAEAVDGDTLHVQADGTRWKVRLIGVDAPEAHPSDKLDRDARRTRQDKRTILRLGKQASEFTRGLCERRSCRLEYDPANAARGHRDKYGRLLAFVWLTGEGGAEALVNAEIIRQGFGKAMTQYPFDEGRKAEFLLFQREARAEGRGLWGEWKP